MTITKSRTISPVELSSVLGSGNSVDLLDVRTPAEYAGVHVPGAVLAPLNELKVEAFLAQHTPGRPIYVLCHSGARASKAIEQFSQAGCEDCILVEGGTQAWINAGLPVSRGARTVLPLMRQVQIAAGSLVAIGSILALAVNLWFTILPLFVGCGLLFAGISGFCGMAHLLARMPWNQAQDVRATHCNQE